MTSTQDDLNRIVEEIQGQSRYSYLEKHLGKQDVPLFFVQVLHLMLRTRTLPTERIHRYCVTATLLQMGLDVHESVTEGALSADGMRARQLAVLTGDYFSSLYYRELAEHGEVQGIVALSKAICDVNEAKMERYAMNENSEFSWPCWLELSKQIHGGLITALASFFYGNDQGSDPWVRLGSHLVLLSLLEETSPMLGRVRSLPEGLVEVLAAETFSLIKEVRPLEVRHDLYQVLQYSNIFPNRLEEYMVREG
ncbi:Heptaprenyl diphosphate synthase (HEPPP synthase) subunit 1 [Marininema mesophilum]|uniref:Heptaprenyl diphosphate synthase (HEPPP synthase) subunit 1 n=1 Tax=Marininema mesophilum TaxID=1048340 RepID=A0A1H2US00_9BACL|nr:heptaprenyl diphosphate synthase component 1 [Marininema mesophilum]SDW58872.1 Heptaprenyl diphosphate synthase (HEPPP synthase) subunit 1 [Marininema mesophilum]